MQKNILVVDDDALFIELIADLLHGQYTIIGAHSAREGLQVLGSRDVDAIASDVEMPNMNGIEFHRLVSLEERWKDIPFVFVTAVADARIRAYAERYPVTIIEKTRVIYDLAPALERMLTVS